MTTYLVLIHGREDVWDAETDDDRAAKEAAHRAFADKAGDRLLGGGELAPARAATGLRRGVDGAPLVTTGPFTEAAEVVGGYYLLRVTDRAEALDLVGLLPEPGEPGGGVELRELVEG